jgi:hypothetical protein
MMPTTTEVNGWKDVTAFSGPTVSAQINAALYALTTANAQGGVLYFPPGTYQITEPLSAIPSGVTLLGCGSGVSVLNALATIQPLQIGTQPASGPSVSGVTISDLSVTFEGSDGALNGTGISIINATAIRILSVAIGDANTAISIDGGELGGVYGACSEIYCDQIEVSNGYSGTACIMIAGGLTGYTACNSDVHITNALVGSQGSESTWSTYGIVVANGSDVYVINTVVQSLWYPLALQPTVADATVSGVYIANSQFSAAYQNAFLASSDANTSNLVWDVKVTSSLFGASEGGGGNQGNSILLQGAIGTNVTRNINIGSSIEYGGGQNGIYVYQCSQIVISGCGVFHNGDFAPGTYQGVYISGNTDVVVGSTTSTYNGNGWSDTTIRSEYGIQVDGSKAEYIQVFGNMLTDNAAGFNAPSGAGGGAAVYSLAAAQGVDYNPVGLSTPTLTGSSIQNTYLVAATVYFTGSTGTLSISSNGTTYVALNATPGAGVGVRLCPGQYLKWSGTPTSWQWFLD